MQKNPNRVENKLHPFYQIIPIKFDHEANVGLIQINLHRFDLSWKGKWNQNIVIFLLPEASVSITMMLFLLYLWHRITFWRWRAAVSFCHEIAFWGLSTSLSFRILLQRLLLQDLEHATFSARKQGKEYYICTFPSRTSVSIYIWWSFYFYGGKEQL